MTFWENPSVAFSKALIVQLCPVLSFAIRPDPAALTSRASSCFSFCSPILLTPLLCSGLFYNHFQVARQLSFHLEGALSLLLLASFASCCFFSMEMFVSFEEKCGSVILFSFIREAAWSDGCGSNTLVLKFWLCDVWLNRCSLCVCACACLAESHCWGQADLKFTKSLSLPDLEFDIVLPILSSWVLGLQVCSIVSNSWPFSSSLWASVSSKHLLVISVLGEECWLSE